MSDRPGLKMSELADASGVLSAGTINGYAHLAAESQGKREKSTTNVVKRRLCPAGGTP